MDPTLMWILIAVGAVVLLYLFWPSIVRHRTTIEYERTRLAQQKVQREAAERQLYAARAAAGGGGAGGVQP